MNVSRLSIVAVAVLCCAASEPAGGSLTAREKTMLQKDVSGGAYEQQLSALALKKSSNPQVKAFAEMDLRDHTALIEEAKQVSGEGTAAPQADLTTQDKQKVASLTKQTGKAFDEAYVQAMGAVNEEDKRSLGDNVAQATSPQVKQFLKHESAIDQKHFSMVQAIHIDY